MAGFSPALVFWSLNFQRVYTTTLHGQGRGALSVSYFLDLSVRSQQYLGVFLDTDSKDLPLLGQIPDVWYQSKRKAALDSHRFAWQAGDEGMVCLDDRSLRVWASKNWCGIQQEDNGPPLAFGPRGWVGCVDNGFRIWPRVWLLP